jgi:hypothetical protein
MTSASERANRLGPLRTVREQVFVGGQPALKLSCGHVVFTSAAYIRHRRCRSCLQLRREADAVAMRTSDSPFMVNLRRAVGASK